MTKPRRRRVAFTVRRRAASRAASRALRRTLVRVRRPVLLVVGVVVLATVLGAGAFAASGFYGQYGAPRTPSSIRSWQLRPQSYLASDCPGCHSDTAAVVNGQPHAQLVCETCHVPSLAHPGPITGVVQMLPASTQADCIACHARTEGRPAGFAQVALDAHYAGAACLECHDPHTSTAVKPREVTHPLANLPPCATCHAPLGLKQFPANHEQAPDEVCLACHKSGAGGP